MLKKLIKKFGPGFITGAADDDVSGIVTYSTVGATTGYSQLWLMLLSMPLLIIVQGICAKIGDVLNMGLGKAIKVHFGFRVALFATSTLLLANIVTIAADFAGMAAVLNMLVPKVPIYIFLFPVAIMIWTIVVFENYRVIEKILLFVASILVVYIFAALIVKPDWLLVVKETFLPDIRFTTAYFAAAVALLGTTITPYMFFWQTSEEVEEHRTAQQGTRALAYVTPGMIFTNVIAFFIIVTTGTVLFKAGVTNLENAAQVAETLKPLVGNFSYVLFAVGVLGAGFLAIPVLAASSAYAFAEIFDLREGLSQSIHKAKGFYAIFSLTFVASLLIALTPLNPIKMLFYSQILVGILAPILLVLIVLISTSHKIMGKYKISLPVAATGWLTIFIMVISVGGFFYTLLTQGGF